MGRIDVRPMLGSRGRGRTAALAASMQFKRPPQRLRTARLGTICRRRSSRSSITNMAYRPEPHEVVLLTLGDVGEYYNLLLERVPEYLKPAQSGANDQVEAVPRATLRPKRQRVLNPTRRRNAAAKQHET